MKRLLSKYLPGLGAMAIIFAILLLALGYEKFILRPERKAENPRLKNGKDVIITHDSIYFIHFSIDSAEEKEYEPEDTR